MADTDEARRSRAERAVRRAQRRRDRAQTPFLHLPQEQPHTVLPPLEILDPEQVEQIHQASMTILEEIGLDFLDDEALDILARAGAKVDRDARHAWMDRELVLEAVSQAPSSFTWHARNPARSLVLGDRALVFAPNGGTVFVQDLDRGRRPGTLADYEALVKLTQMCNLLHTAGEQLVVPHDVPVPLRHLERLRLAVTLSDKVLMEAAHGRVIPQDALAVARLVFGGELPPDGPVIGGVINVNSPLRYDGRMLGGLISYARAGQVTIITPFILAGVMGPVTLAGALAQQNAEALAGIALAQLVRPGAPVIYGGFTTNADLRSGAPAFGTPEGAWAILAGGQMARRYGLPYRGSGTLNTSKLPDAQAAAETLWALWPTVLAHTHFVLHAVGWLEAGLTVSFEKFLLDAENLAMFHRFLQGFPVDEEGLALASIRAVGPGGHHLDTAHTRARYTTAFYQPFLSDRQPFESWQEAGALDAPARANRLWKALLAQYEPPALDPGLAEALEAFIARRKEELAGADLYR